MPAARRLIATWSITLAVRDLPIVLRWYEDVFVFRLVAERPGRTGHPLEARLRRSPHAELVLLIALPAHPRAINRPGSGVTLTIGTDEYLEALVDRALTRGGTLVEGPAERPGQRQAVTIADPDS